MIIQGDSVLLDEVDFAIINQIEIYCQISGKKPDDLTSADLKAIASHIDGINEDNIKAIIENIELDI